MQDSFSHTGLFLWLTAGVRERIGNYQTELSVPNKRESNYCVVLFHRFHQIEEERIIFGNQLITGKIFCH